MPHRFISGYLLPGGLPVSFRIEGGRIRDWDAGTFRPVDPCWILPPLFDIQNNGFAGLDFQQDNPRLEDLVNVAHALREHACGGIFPTFITDDWPRLLERFRQYKALRDSEPILGEVFRGWHIEGPFLSANPGFHGAHPPEHMRNPRPEDMESLREIAGPDPLLVTLAPEREGSLPTIAKAVDLGIQVWLGHTDADAGCIRSAATAGATGFTHFGNGCPQTLDRHDNIFWRALTESRLYLSLIPDGLHVSPLFLRLLLDLVPRHRLVATTDCMAAAGAPPGRYQIGRLEIEVGEDRVVRQPGRYNFAGSSLEPWRGVHILRQKAGLSFTAAWSLFSDAPRRACRLPPDLDEGAPASFLRAPMHDPEINEWTIFWNGRESAGPPNPFPVRVSGNHSPD